MCSVLSVQLCYPYAKCSEGVFVIGSVFKENINLPAVFAKCVWQIIVLADGKASSCFLNCLW